MTERRRSNVYTAVASDAHNTYDYDEASGDCAVYRGAGCVPGGSTPTRQLGGAALLAVNRGLGCLAIRADCRSGDIRRIPVCVALGTVQRSCN
jgi:hypothetical protein